MGDVRTTSHRPMQYYPFLVFILLINATFPTAFSFTEALSQGYEQRTESSVKELIFTLLETKGFKGSIQTYGSYAELDLSAPDHPHPALGLCSIPIPVD
eukprot:Em0009g11a